MALQPKESPILVSDFVGVCEAWSGLLVMLYESLASAKLLVLDCDRPCGETQD